MDGSRRMTVADWGWTGLGVLLGAFVGMIVGGMIVATITGLWLFFLLALPLLLAQLLFEGAIAGAFALWRRWRGYPPRPEPTPRRLRTDLPWLRRYCFHIGFVAGGAYGLWAMPPLGV